MKLKTKSPSKQRKRLYEAPYHSRSHVFSVHLSSELRGSHNSRTMSVKKGDTIRVLRGDYKGFEGKILRVNRKGYRIIVDGINREKADGTSIPVAIHPSKVEVIRLDLGDKWRDRILRRKEPEEREKPQEKPVEKLTKKVKKRSAKKRTTKKPEKTKEKE
jgi:large subunit ribosomal protein L24